LTKSKQKEAAMTSNSENPYETVKSSEGNEYFCPQRLLDRGAVGETDLSDRCVEADVVRRYSGNIDVTG
jgi:hypothetical protein